jgi:hypothetical protein
MAPMQIDTRNNRLEQDNNKFYTDKPKHPAKQSNRWLAKHIYSK